MASSLILLYVFRRMLDLVVNRRFAFGLLLTLAGAASLWADTSVVFNEIMYHPVTNEANLEHGSRPHQEKRKPYI